MADEIDALRLQVRLDTREVQQEVAAVRASLEGPLQAGADRAGRAIEATLLRAVRTGKFGFEDLQRVALSVLGAIAGAAGGGAAGDKGSIGQAIGSILGSLLGAPGRATGGPVSPARPYLVGERGPELFVPTASGRIEQMAGGGARTVNVAIRVQADAGAAPAALQRSSRQVARAVRAALAEQE